jgi:uncharacterized damage-inducible protein DinB
MSVIHDLKGEDHMSPAVGMLFAMVKENWTRLESITDSMSQEELDYKGPGNLYNSSAQLLRHIMFVDLNWVYRMKGQQLPYDMLEQYGPMIDKDNKLPFIEGVPRDTLISQHHLVMTTLQQTCSLLTDEDLNTVLTFGHENEKQASVRWALWHMADHNRYHQAHINQLRKWYKNDTSNR